MFKNIIIIVISSLLFTQTISRGIIIINYIQNTEFYLASCVNKDKPELACDGKCQVAEQMEKENQKDRHTVKQSSFSDLVFIEDFSFLNSSEHLFFPKQETFLLLTIGSVIERANSLFYPPDFIV